MGSAIRITEVTITPVAFRDPALLNAADVREPYAWRGVERKVPRW
jgi:glucarate dehydratase